MVFFMHQQQKEKPHHTTPYRFPLSAVNRMFGYIQICRKEPIRLLNSLNGYCGKPSKYYYPKEC